MPNSLEQLRTEIDAINTTIQNALNERARISLEVAALKAQDKNPEFYRPDREKAILATITENNPGPLTNEAVQKIFKAIIKECRMLQEDWYKEQS